MLRSMYSGISGMKNFQTKLDVIGNNIANVNTFGFKKGRAMFKDLVSQQVAGASAPVQNGRGGTNPKQVGLGAQLASIDTIHTQGSLQTTNRTLDLSISGDGYFVVTDGANDYYTRAGNFYLDENGDIVNNDGFYLKEVNGNGTDYPINIPDTASEFSIGQDGSVTYTDPSNTTNPLVVEGTIALAKFPNNGGLQKVGNNLYIETINSGDVSIALPGSGGTGSIEPGTLEMSNVDLSEEFTEMIVAQRGFQANTRIITTSDEILQELVNLKR
ncbi:flagellar basal body rod protein FlgG [Cytobacillus sp. IB215316]|uniref:flagellar basal body rod protein FlgG n=1 Tax=Cytobacillus sp. IB215316 TaxID=3097354 RepID=UPI002A1158CA|nr:flagellar basal body rod protein FlgG [Cytobacillus sp. IB215316]MDX8362247.1 flagellar basal body rod protein FlgG [Cytobacillus sp. IB215316]